MTSIRIAADPGSSGGTPKSNEELRRQLLDDMAGPAGRSPYTVRRYTGFTETLVEAAGDYSLLELTSPQLRQFADDMALRCRHFRYGPRSPVCLAKADLGSCRELASTQPCPKYQPLRATTLDQHMTMLDRTFEYFHIHGWRKDNPATLVRKGAAVSNRRARVTQRNLRPREPFSLRHVRLLRNVHSLEHQALWFFMAKYGLRPGEAQRLERTPEYLDLDARILTVPKTPEGGGKRLANPHLPLDKEAMDFLQDVWLPYRDALAQQTTKLLVNMHGNAWSARHYNSRFADILRHDCKQVKIAPKAGGYFDLKAFRRFFTKHLEDNGCPGDWVRIMRGDQVPGAVKHYWDPDSELHRIYDLYGPKLG